MRTLFMLTMVLLPGGLVGQGTGRELKTGREIFRAGCVACHGADGKGAPQASRGFEPPSTFPDFTACVSTAREPDRDWSAIIHNGGPARGFSEIMPSFREALTDPQIDEVVRHLRSLCGDRNWARGELNLPRALITEKAFPEDEAVIDAAVDTKGSGSIVSRAVYERRLGARGQLDIVVPFNLQKPAGGNWLGGVGDLSVGYKRTIASSLRTGSIFSLAGEAVLPTGDKARGMGKGVTVFEGFAAFGQILPRNTFFQGQAGLEVPTHRDDAAKAVFWRTVVGKTFTQNQGLGRLWTPMVELLADRELVRGEPVNWDVVPQFQVTLNRRQHIRASFGVRIPVNNTASRSTQVMMYLLWDWFDGGLRDGWK